MTRREFITTALGLPLFPLARANAQNLPTHDTGELKPHMDDVFMLNLMINVTRIQAGLKTLLLPGEGNTIVEVSLEEDDEGTVM